MAAAPSNPRLAALGELGKPFALAGASGSQAEVLRRRVDEARGGDEIVVGGEAHPIAQVALRALPETVARHHVAGAYRIPGRVPRFDVVADERAGDDVPDHVTVARSESVVAREQESLAVPEDDVVRDEGALSVRIELHATIGVVVDEVVGQTGVSRARQVHAVVLVRPG